jgi:hypothetical protein
VPLYREGINPLEKGTKPTIRMAGQAVSQRSTLSVNHGTYYMDTTVSETTQRAGGSDSLINVFMGDHTYYTFLLFAKPKPDDPLKGPPATKQVYKMYIGVDDFDKDTDVYPVRAEIEAAPPTFDSSDMPMTTDYTNGILTVTLDMSFDEFKTNYKKVAEGKCQPRTFCSWNGSTCGCGLDSKDTLYKQCQAVCSTWTNKDVDCPDGGCYGFAVKFPHDFAAKDQFTPPTPDCYPNNTDWNVKFSPAGKLKATSCYYASTPPTGTFCTAGTQ